MIDFNNNLAIELKDRALYFFEQNCETALLPFPDEVRREYYKNGNRSNFEKLYFARRDFLSSCAVLSLYDKKYLVFLEKAIKAVCDEYCWALPAHTDGTKNGDGSVVDLFVAETAFALSEIYTVFCNHLSENLLCIIKSNVSKRLIENYNNHTYWWESCKMNWASVCAGYTGGSMIYLFPDEFKTHKERIIKTLGCYIDGFSDDGFCLEGVSYWLYGFTAYTVFADLLYKYYKEDLFSDEKVKKVAGFASRCFIKGDTCVSFSDSDVHFKADIALQNYLRGRLPDYVSCIPEERTCFHNSNTKWINYYRSLLWNNTEKCDGNTFENVIYSSECGQLTVNKNAYSFAIKGGNNNEPHNHNDLGSFIYSDKNGQVFCDLGSGRYTADYFNDEKRYGIFCNSSFSHSIPIINNEGQKTGVNYFAKLAFEKNTAICDLSHSYDCDSLKSFIRKAQLSDNGVVLTDSFEFSENAKITERFVSLRKAEEEKGRLIFGSTSFEFPLDKVNLTIKKEKHLPHEYEKDFVDVYCYDFELKDGVNEITFVITTKNISGLN